LTAKLSVFNKTNDVLIVCAIKEKIFHRRNSKLFMRNVLQVTEIAGN